MRVLLLGGGGEVGSVAAHVLAQAREIQHVTVADWDSTRIEEVVNRIPNNKADGVQIDICDKEALLQHVKQGGYSVIVNTTPYIHNLKVMEIALQTGCNLIDLGGLYHVTLKQLELHPQFRDAGVTAVVGCGLCPGLVNIVAKLGARKLDRVESVEVWIGHRFEEHRFSFPTNLRTFLDAFTLPAILYRMGEVEEMLPASGRVDYTFPDPIGTLPCVYLADSLIATLPHTIPGIRRVEIHYGFSNLDILLTVIDSLRYFRITERKPLPRAGVQAPLIDIVSRVMRDPPRIRYHLAVVVTVDGMLERDRTRYTATIVQHHVEALDARPTAFLAGVFAGVAAQELALGVFDPGVFPPEAVFDEEALVAATVKHGVSLQEHIVRERIPPPITR